MSRMMSILEICGFIVCFLVVNYAAIMHDFKCIAGTSKTAGYTIPHGDIKITYGEPLDLYCTLYNYTIPRSNYNASENITFTNINGFLEPSMVTAINESTALLHIDKPEIVKLDNYMCIFNDTVVCMNSVSVKDYRLPNITDFNCISWYFKRLECSWTVPEDDNNINYTLKYFIGNYGKRPSYECTKITKSNSTNGKFIRQCNWTVRSKNSYRPSQLYFEFQLTVANDFGNQVYNFPFTHFANVLAERPKNLTIISLTSSSIYLQWSIPDSMDVYGFHLYHRIFYQCEYDKGKWHLAPLITNVQNRAVIQFNLTGLEYPYGLYDIRVSSRSSEAVKDIMWSENTTITTLLGGARPKSPPITITGNFRIKRNNLQTYDVDIYWQQIPNNQRNGPNFTYDIEIEGDTTIKPHDLTNCYAQFLNLSIFKNFKFNIWSLNSIGRSINKSTIFIPKHSDLVPQPSNFIIVELGKGDYELIWTAPASDNIENYTVWYSDVIMGHRCSSKVQWKQLPVNVTTYKMDLDPNINYQFAISANSKTSSSGMVWASCNVNRDRNVVKMRNITCTNFNSTYAHIIWNLDCYERSTSIKGFIVYYCPLVSLENGTCKQAERNQIFKASQSVSGVDIIGLSPYTTYMISVGIVFNNGDYSEQSIPIHITTLEAAPSTPPTNLQATKVTNTSIELTWQEPTVINGVIKHYEIRFNNVMLNTSAEQPTSFTLRNLASYTNYSISVQACTTSCSVKSELLNVTTAMGYPPKIRKPSVGRQNDTSTTFIWDKNNQLLKSNGIYEARLIGKNQYGNKTYPLYQVHENVLEITNCGVDRGKYNTFYLSVRAVNRKDGQRFDGPWSDTLESYCYVSGNYIMYLVITACLVLAALVCYVLKRSYTQCMLMKNVEVKLPPGLTPMIAEHVLDKISASSSDSEENSMNYEKTTTITSSDNCTDIPPEPFFESSSAYTGSHSDNSNEKSYVSCGLFYEPSTVPSSYVLTSDASKETDDKPYVAWNIPCH